LPGSRNWAGTTCFSALESDGLREARVLGLGEAAGIDGEEEIGGLFWPSAASRSLRPAAA
jgi:hypothetical protein